MPFTATLSRKFYEKLGDDVANELVTLMNGMDQSYRQEFRDLFAANFGQLRAEMEALNSDVRSQLAALEAKLLKWLFLFWIGTMGTILAMLKL